MKYIKDKIIIIVTVVLCICGLISIIWTAPRSKECPQSFCSLSSASTEIVSGKKLIPDVSSPNAGTTFNNIGE